MAPRDPPKAAFFADRGRSWRQGRRGLGLGGGLAAVIYGAERGGESLRFYRRLLRSARLPIPPLSRRNGYIIF